MIIRGDTQNDWCDQYMLHDIFATIAWSVTMDEVAAEEELLMKAKCILRESKAHFIDDIPLRLYIAIMVYQSQE